MSVVHNAYAPVPRAPMPMVLGVVMGLGSWTSPRYPWALLDIDVLSTYSSGSSPRHPLSTGAASRPLSPVLEQQVAMTCASSVAVVNTGQVLIEPLPVVEVALTLNAIQLE